MACEALRRLTLVMCFALSIAASACKGQGSDVAPEPGPHPMATAGSIPSRLRVVAAPEKGDVATIVRDASAGALREKRRLVVYVGATWCEPCKRFVDAAQHGELDSIFGDVTLLEFDLDRDGERLRSASYVSEFIPLFALPGADGVASGNQVEGAIKGDGAVAFVVQRLARLLAH